MAGTKLIRCTTAGCRTLCAKDTPKCDACTAAQRERERMRQAQRERLRELQGIDRAHDNDEY